VFAMGQAIAVRTVDSCVQEHQRKIAQIVASPPSRPAPAGRYPNRPARNNAWTEARRRPLQWPIDRPAPGFSDAVSPHIDHLTVGLYPLSRNCCPPHALIIGCDDTLFARLSAATPSAWAEAA
jgi:hypothetical protein